ncbi:site-specific integrase [Ktedonobacter sp. SOSP1-52]|uniref:tyrosine-type recombinase/integrase n=1 Tax=Ktedonobacter sp. SOSP1-52 TaxID=2778366 RepID=UPI001914E12B|nr:site-specific integrase [Ktedonobacter sp. SOSP1-52]GHO65054.1 site-specific integrase [Ktedonobacter sp. SOSP1-52]
MARRGHGEGSIYHRNDGRWAAAISLDNGKRKTLYGKTRKEVQEKLKKALHEQQEGRMITAPQQTIKHYLEYWLEEVHRQSIRIRTYERYEEIVRLHLLPALGHHMLQKLAPQHLQTFYNSKLREGLSATTVISFHNVLHKALDHAMRWRLMAYNVCDLVSPPRRKHIELETLNLEQAQQFLTTVRGCPQEALFLLAIGTGMRRGEIMGLKWRDIDLATGKLQIRRVLTRIPSRVSGKGYIEDEPKSEKSRRNIVLPSFVLEGLKQHGVRQLEAKLKAGPRWEEHDYVFCTSVGTHVNPDRDIQEPFKKLLKKAGLPNIRFHDLRHSAATLMLSMGVHPKIVQEILGHSRINMTLDVYSHVLPTMQQEAMRKLNDALGS